MAQPQHQTEYIFNVNFSLLERQIIQSPSNVEAAHQYIAFFHNSAQQNLYSKKYLLKHISHSMLFDGFFKVLEAQIWLQERAKEDPEIALVATRERRMARRICVSKCIQWKIAPSKSWRGEMADYMHPIGSEAQTCNSNRIVPPYGGRWYEQ